jgi:hypothetical protein
VFGGLKKVIQEFRIFFQSDLVILPMLFKDFLCLLLFLFPYSRQALDIVLPIFLGIFLFSFVVCQQLFLGFDKIDVVFFFDRLLLFLR